MIHFLYFSSFLLIALTHSKCYGQTNQSIRTGRPGQAIGPYVVGTGYFQVQSGVDQSWTNGDSKQQTQLNNNVLRLGVDEKFEVSSVINLQKDKITKPSEQEASGFSEFQLGFRYNLSEEPRGLIPGFGIQTRFKLTNVDSDYQSKQMAPVITFVTHHKLTDSMALGNNFGVSYDGSSTIPKYFFVTNLSFPLFGPWSSFIEVYGNSKDSIAAVYVDTGLAYAVNNDLQLDTYAGGGNNHGISEFFISLGLSWRTKFLR